MPRRRKAVPWALLALGAIACAPPARFSALERSPVAPRGETRTYVESARHLSSEQAQAMLEGRPFEGMTLAEATLAMRLLEASLARDGATLRAIFLGGDGRLYHIDFQGDPERVVFFSLFAEDEIRLPEPEELRPQPPIPLPRR